MWSAIFFIAPSILSPEGTAQTPERQEIPGWSLFPSQDSDVAFGQDPGCFDPETCGWLISECAPGGELECVSGALKQSDTVKRISVPAGVQDPVDLRRMAVNCLGPGAGDTIIVTAAHAEVDP